MDWKDVFREKNEVVLSTYSKESGPHAIVAISQGFTDDDKLLLNACQTNTSVRNIKIDRRISVVGLTGGYFRIKGVAELYDSGRYFKISEERNKGPKVKYSIVITVTEVFDLDKVKKIF